MSEEVKATSDSRFYALESGQVPSPFDETFPDFLARDFINLRVVPVGEIFLPSGLLEVSDPFMFLAECAATSVPAGRFPVFVTIADITLEHNRSHEREAYLSVVFCEGEACEVRQALDTEGNPLFVGVDTGTVGFCDHTAARTCMPEGVNWYETFYDSGVDGSWFDLMDSPEHYEKNMANIVLPLAQSGENVVLTHSGWGDGYYAVKTTHDSEGNLLALHVDLQVVDLGEEDDEEE